MSIVLDGTAGITSPAINAGNIVGQVCFFGMTTAPDGFLKANGAAISRTTFAALFTAIGTTYGAGDGSTTFALPDLRGEFPRGWDDGRGVDSGRAFASAQGHGFASHNHAMDLFGGVATTVGDTNGRRHPMSSTIGGVTTGNQSTTHWTLGGSETRPRNVALLACIKF